MPSLAEVFIFDAIRTPLGRGKSTGKLHTQTPLRLVSSLLRELSRRYPPVQQSTDEVILGCCEQYNDQGGNLARSSALQAGYRVTTPGFMVSTILRIRLGRRQHRRGEGDVGPGRLDHRRRRGNAFALFHLRFRRSDDF